MSPASLAFGPNNILTINGAVAGVLIDVLEAMRAAKPGTAVLSWVNALLDGWTVLAPCLLGGITHLTRVIRC